MLEFLNTPLVQHFFPLTLITFLMMLCLLLLSMSIDTTVLILIVISHLICGNNENWLLNLNLIYETLGWSSKWLVDFMLEKLNLFHLTGQVTLVLLMWKGMGVFLKKNRLLRCWGSLCLLNWIGTVALSLLQKLPPRGLEPWFVLWSFFLRRLLCISNSHAWDTVVTSGLVPLVVTWNC